MQWLTRSRNLLRPRWSFCNRTGPVKGPVLRQFLVARWVGIVSAACIGAGGRGTDRSSSDADRHSTAYGCNANVMNANARTTNARMTSASMTNASTAPAAAKCEGVS